MVDNSPYSANWMQAWTDAQSQFWDAWSSNAQKMMMNQPKAASSNPMDFWKDNMESWMSAFSPATRLTPEQQLMRQIFSVGDGFLRMGEDVFKAFQDLQKGAKAGHDWTTALNGIMEQAKAHFSSMAGTGNMSGSPAFKAFWGMPLETWQRAMSFTNPLVPGDMFKFVKGHGRIPGMDEIRANMSQFMATPALGHNREMQEQSQKAVVQWMEYEESFQDYLKVMGQVATDSLDLFQQKLMVLAATDKPFTSLKEIYDLWVECGETAHAKATSSEEYSRINARMVNASVQLKRNGQNMMEESMGSMNMPTRSELDTVHRHLQELKRRIQALEETTSKGLKKRDLTEDLSALREDVERLPIRELRSELESLKKQMEEPAEVVKAEEVESAEGGDSADAKKSTTTPRRPTTRTTRPAPTAQGE